VTTANANDTAIGIESFGDCHAPLILLAGGTEMICSQLARCGSAHLGAVRVSDARLD
jgi:hypothetical protein